MLCSQHNLLLQRSCNHNNIIIRSLNNTEIERLKRFYTAYKYSENLGHLETGTEEQKKKNEMLKEFESQVEAFEAAIKANEEKIEVL